MNVKYSCIITCHASTKEDTDTEQRTHWLCCAAAIKCTVQFNKDRNLNGHQYSVLLAMSYAAFALAN